MLGKLVESVLTFSEMLDLRRIVVDKSFVIIGGNQRYKALKKILDRPNHGFTGGGLRQLSLF